MKKCLLWIVAALSTAFPAYGQGISIIYSQGIEGGENSFIYDELLKRTVQLETKLGNKYIIVSPNSPDGFFPNKEGLKKAFEKARTSNSNIHDLNLYFLGHGSIFSEELKDEIEDSETKTRMSLIPTPAVFRSSTNIDEEVTPANIFTISGTKKNKEEDYEPDTFEEFIKYSISPSDLRKMITDFKQTHPQAITNVLMQNCHSGAFGLTLGQLEDVHFFNAAQAQDMAITFLTGQEEDDNSFEDYFSLMIQNRSKGLSLNESHNLAIEDLINLYSENQNMVLKSPGKLLSLPRSALEQYANSWCYNRNQNLDCVDCLEADKNIQNNATEITKSTLLLNLKQNHEKAIGFLSKIKKSSPCEKSSSNYLKMLQEGKRVLDSKKAAIDRVINLTTKILSSPQEKSLDQNEKSTLKLYKDALSSSCTDEKGDFNSNCIGYLYGIEGILLSAKIINQPSESDYENFNKCMMPYYYVIAGSSPLDFERNISASHEKYDCIQQEIESLNLVAINGILNDETLEERLCIGVENRLNVYRAETQCFENFTNNASELEIQKALDLVQ